MDQLAVDDIEKELETEQIEENMKEAERQEAGVDGAVEVEEERFTLPEPEGGSSMKLSLALSILPSWCYYTALFKLSISSYIVIVMGSVLWTQLKV